jgi:hypothetical protein
MCCIVKDSVNDTAYMRKYSSVTWGTHVLVSLPCCADHTAVLCSTQRMRTASALLLLPRAHTYAELTA